jgi:hypothetical protein
MPAVSRATLINARPVPPAETGNGVLTRCCGRSYENFDGDRGARRVRKRLTAIMASESELVSRINQRLIATLGERRFANWFEKSARLNVCADELIVVTGSPYLQGWIQRQFAGALREAAGEVLGPGSRVRVEVSSQLAALVAESTADAAPRELPAHRRAAPQMAAARRRFADLPDFIPGTKNKLAFTAAQPPRQSPPLPEERSTRCACTAASAAARRICWRAFIARFVVSSPHCNCCF